MERSVRMAIGVGASKTMSLAYASTPVKLEPI